MVTLISLPVLYSGTGSSFGMSWHMATSIVLFLLINLVGKGCFQPSPFWSVAQPGIRGVGLELPVRDAHRNPGTVLVFHQVGREFRGVLRSEERRVGKECR